VSRSTLSTSETRKGLHTRLSSSAKETASACHGVHCRCLASSIEARVFPSIALVFSHLLLPLVLSLSESLHIHVALQREREREREREKKKKKKKKNRIPDRMTERRSESIGVRELGGLRLDGFGLSVEKNSIPRSLRE